MKGFKTMKKRNKLMKVAAALLCFVILASISQVAIFAEQPSFVNNEEWEILASTNLVRQIYGLDPLSVFEPLQKSAQLRAAELNHLFDHTRPNGSDCFTALNNIAYTTAGENIAAGQETAADAIAAWLESEGHLENIMNPDFTHLGAGYAAGGAPYYDYWSQMFIGGCDVVDFSINTRNGYVELLCDYDEEDLYNLLQTVVTVKCDKHGESYTTLPLTLDFNDYESLEKVGGEPTLEMTCYGITRSFPCYVNFADVKAGSWYFDAVRYAFQNKLFNGTSDTDFEPNAPMTRAMLVTVLYRLDKSLDKGNPVFNDVPTDSWYYDAVNWAAKNDIVNGVGNGKFEPNSNITREQMATILFRYLNYSSSNVSQTRGDLGTFKDNNDISNYAKEALSWALGNGLITGKENNMLEPKGPATRAQVATLLMRYLSNSES